MLYSLTNGSRVYERNKVDASIRADHNAYVRSFTKVLWRGSENGKPATIMFWADISSDIGDPGIDPDELDYYSLGPPPKVIPPPLPRDDPFEER